MTGSDQTAVIKAYLEENGKDNPSNGELSLTRLSAVAYCGTVGTDSDPISKISGG